MEAMRNSWTDDRLDDLNRKVDHGFERMEERFKEVDRRFDKVDKRFDKVEVRLDRLEERFDELGIKVDRLAERFDRLLQGLIFTALAMLATLFAGLVAAVVALAS